MRTKLWLVIALLIATTTSVSAGEPDVHLDLAASTAFPNFFAIPFVFEDSNLECPEDRWTMTVSKGMLKIHHLNLPPMEPPTDRMPSMHHMKPDPSDDVTYRLRYVGSNCHVDIDIRQQVRSEGEWKSLLVVEERRPSLSEEARQEAVRRRLGNLALPSKDAKPMTQADLDKINAMLRSKGPPRWAGSTFAMGFPFDAAPSSCMEVMGEYLITKNSFALSLFAPLPGELNKVVMDGTDLDEAHARIYLTRDDCRFEFTISQSAVRNGESVPIPLRRAADTGKTPLPRLSPRD
jgi:hypothetical protein